MNNIIKDIISEKIIYQPELSSYIFYGKGNLELIDVCISNKLIKREIYIKSLNSINYYYLNQKMTNWEDGLINYMLFKKANSFYYSKHIGYYYIKNNQSVTSTYTNNIKKTIKNGFIYLKFIFQYTNNTKYEKAMAECIFNNIFLDISNINYYKKITKDLNFYFEIIDLYLENKFISSSCKYKMKIIKEQIKKNKN